MPPPPDDDDDDGRALLPLDIRGNFSAGDPEPPGEREGERSAALALADGGGSANAAE